MAVSIGISKWRPDPSPEAPARIYIEFSDGSGRNFDAPEQLQIFVSQQIEANVEMAKLFAMAKGQKLDPTFTSPNAVEGKTCTINTATGNLVSFN